MPGLDTNTKLLVHANGSDLSAAVIDSGFRSAMGGTQPGGHVGTLVGTAQISAAQSKFGGTSLLLDGDSDYVTLLNSTDFDFGVGNFTLEAFVYSTNRPASGNAQVIINKWNTDTSNKEYEFSLLNDNGSYKLQLRCSANGS